MNLRGNGLSTGAPITLSYLAASNVYQVGSVQMTRAALIAQAQLGSVIATLTAHLRSGVYETTPQPLLAPVGANCGSSGPTGDPALPSGTSFTVEGKYVTATDPVFVDGQPVPTATIGVAAGASCATNTGLATHTLSIALNTTPANGMHLLQVQSGTGLLSNEVPFCVGSTAGCNN